MNSSDINHSNTPAATATPVLVVADLHIRVCNHEQEVELVSGVSFSLAPGRILALVGESGCGKSLTCMTLTRLNAEPPFRCTGSIKIQGQEVMGMDEAALRRLRGGTVSYIFQDPAASLDPVMTIGAQIAEAIRLHDRGERQVEARVHELLRQVGIPEPEQRAKAYPHQLSGGMQQRAMIAMALSCRPAILVADEPTTALDVTIQAQILALLLRLCRETGTAIILVTHNLGIVAGMADDVGVMYAGQLVELAPAKELFRQPTHPYTQALLAAVPQLGRRQERLATIPGRVPAPADFAAGCRFSGRCAVEQPQCKAELPPRHQVSPRHHVQCVVSARIRA